MLSTLGYLEATKKPHRPQNAFVFSAKKKLEGVVTKQTRFQKNKCVGMLGVNKSNE